MKILSLCTSAGLWDKAWIEAEHQVIPACEIMPHKRVMYNTFVWDDPKADWHLAHDLKHVPDLVKGQHFDGIIGGIPRQSRSKTRAMCPDVKFGDLLEPLKAVLACCTWDWALFENVAPLDLEGFNKVRLDAMNFAYPPQSRARWFTYKNITPPTPIYRGTVDTLLAYPAVAARIYGPKRGAVLQGWPDFAKLDFPCAQLQEALADGVPRGLADAWIEAIARDHDCYTF